MFFAKNYTQLSKLFSNQPEVSILPFIKKHAIGVSYCLKTN
jgi:hypothetical protein